MAEKFCIRLAGLNIGVTAMYPHTRAYCRRYLTDGEPDFSVETVWADLEFEYGKTMAEDPNSPIPTVQALEILALYRKIAERMPAYQTFLFHGSVVAVDGEAYLFTAPSGTGKSTHTALWRQVFGQRAVMVNDDKPLLQLRDEGFVACGTPWNGKHRLGEPVEVPLRAVCMLGRGGVNRIVSAERAELKPFLLGQCYRPADPSALLQTLELLDALCSRVNLYKLSCNMEPEAAQIAYAAMQERNVTE